jgi:dTDP-4-amino-4,6-dideoxygalactose transaminase
MTTAEGGVLTTSNDEFARRARLLRAHGVEREPARFLSPKSDDPLAEQGAWFHEMHELGYNYRLTDVQCALGRSQLAKLERFNRRRREIVARYNAAFSGLRHLRTPGLGAMGDAERSAWHLYTVRIDFAGLGSTRTEVQKALRARGVGTQVLYIPVYLQPHYRATYGYAPGKCPKAEAFYAEALSLPLYPSLDDADVAQVIEAVRAVLG